MFICDPCVYVFVFVCVQLCVCERVYFCVRLRVRAVFACESTDVCLSVSVLFVLCLYVCFNRMCVCLCVCVLHCYVCVAKLSVCVCV